SSLTQVNKLFYLTGFYQQQMLRLMNIPLGWTVLFYNEMLRYWRPVKNWSVGTISSSNFHLIIKIEKELSTLSIEMRCFPLFWQPYKIRTMSTLKLRERRF